jgi:hypothetical protein
MKVKISSPGGFLIFYVSPEAFNWKKTYFFQLMITLAFNVIGAI